MRDINPLSFLACLYTQCFSKNWNSSAAKDIFQRGANLDPKCWVRTNIQISIYTSSSRAEHMNNGPKKEEKGGNSENNHHTLKLAEIGAGLPENLKLTAQFNFFLYQCLWKISITENQFCTLFQENTALSQRERKSSTCFFPSSKEKEGARFMLSSWLDVKSRNTSHSLLCSEYVL